MPKRARVPSIVPFQPPLPFRPRPQRITAAPVELPSHYREAALRPEQFARVSGKLWRLVQERPYAAGLVEHKISRLLAGREAA